MEGQAVGKEGEGNGKGERVEEGGGRFTKEGKEKGNGRERRKGGEENYSITIHTIAPFNLSDLLKVSYYVFPFLRNPWQILKTCK